MREKQILWVGNGILTQVVCILEFVDKNDSFTTDRNSERVGKGLFYVSRHSSSSGSALILRIELTKH